jgi:hypothetical protein
MEGAASLRTEEKLSSGKNKIKWKLYFLKINLK